MGIVDRFTKTNTKVPTHCHMETMFCQQLTFSHDRVCCKVLASPIMAMAIVATTIVAYAWSKQVNPPDFSGQEQVNPSCFQPGLSF